MRSLQPFLENYIKRMKHEWNSEERQAYKTRSILRIRRITLNALKPGTSQKHELKKKMEA